MRGRIGRAFTSCEAPILLALLQLLLLPVIGTAQPPVDHPDLYYAFFTSGPPAGTVPINNADRGNFQQVAAAVLSDLNKLNAQRQRYLASVNGHGKQPDPATLMGFDGQRALITLGGVNKMRKGLSFRGWQDFHTWINGPFRQSLPH